MGLGNAELSILFAVVLVVLVIGLIPAIFYLLTLSRTLKQVAPHNQRMTPGEVWLTLIPLFGTVWHFFVVARVADSLAAEFNQRRIPCNEQRPGYNIGLWMLILPLVGFIPILGGLASLAGLVLWIVYWVRIAGYKRQLEEHVFQFGAGNPYQYPPQPGNPYATVPQAGSPYYQPPHTPPGGPNTPQ
jgi:hypothetical protein